MSRKRKKEREPVLANKNTDNCLEDLITAKEAGRRDYVLFGIDAINPYPFLTHEFSMWEAGYMERLQEKVRII